MLSRPLRSVLTGLLLVGLLPAQTDEKKLDAVKTFQLYLRKVGQDPKQIVEAIHTLKGNECPEAAAELAKLFASKDEQVLRAAIGVFATYRDEATFKPYLEEITNLKQTSPRRPLLIEALGKAKFRGALPAFQEILEKDKKTDANTRYEIARAIQDICEGPSEPGAASRPASVGSTESACLGLLLSDAEPPVRMAAADAVGALKVYGLGKQLAELIKDPLWEVQSSAVKAAGRVRPDEAIEPLIAAMRKGGRLKEETADALFQITTLDFGMDPDEWDRQIKKLREIKWRIPTEEELVKKQAARDRANALYGIKKADKTTFVGINTSSTNVLFVIDVSGSMEELVVEHEKFTTKYDNWRKFTIVQAELLRTIESLKENTNFNIIAFATDLDPWKKFLVPANALNKDSARSWVKHLKPLGGVESQDMAAAGLTGSANVGAGKTNTYKALMSMFGYDPDKQTVPTGPTTGKPVKIDKENKLDTVFFLSDGRPSTGKFVDTNEISREVKERNELYKIVVHTIAIGEFQKDFMKKLAGDNGGVFVDLGK